MDIVVYTTSTSFRRYISGVIEQPTTFSALLTAHPLDSKQLHILHLTSFTGQGLDWLQEKVSPEVRLVVCSDQPDIRQMLDCVQAGAKAYCNSFMQTLHYRQMLRLLENGQSWFPPQLLEQTFALAHKAVGGGSPDDRMQNLTEREKQVALAVSEGMSNQQIANEYDISERTVKTHLTNIFKKLQLKDRVGLVLHLK